MLVIIQLPSPPEYLLTLKINPRICESAKKLSKAIRKRNAGQIMTIIDNKKIDDLLDQCLNTLENQPQVAECLNGFRTILPQNPALEEQIYAIKESLEGNKTELGHICHRFGVNELKELSIAQAEEFLQETETTKRESEAGK